MKKLVIATAFVAAASAASAGNMSDPIIEAPVIVDQTAGSSGGMAIPLLLLIAVAAAVAN
ncbi:hypothetical protein [Lentibacter sp.]|uniref:hypothetical protein n=1 Tax=Lentibacter sp. TaxID=2024994 RepID=UPI003F6A3DA0